MNEHTEITIQEVPPTMGARIKVIGVGGGGSNMVSHLIAQGAHPDLELAIANTDAQALSASPAPYKIQLGSRLTKGLGAGMNPEVGKNAAIESIEEIKTLLEGTDIVFVCAGLGGGTGTGAAPIIAKVAKEVGALTVSVVTKPFIFEQSKRARFAEQGLAELKRESDSIVVIPNEKLLGFIDKNLGIKDSFKIVDDVLAHAVNGMSGIILNHGENDINVDFADVRTVMSHKGLALMGIGEASGDEAACDAIKKAIESPLFDNMSINGAMGILVHFHVNPSYSLMKISRAMQDIGGYASENASVIFGTTTDENVPQDSVRITIVATGFEKELVQAKEDNELKLVAPKDLSQASRSARALRKVSGGDYEQNEDLLDIPSYIRHQQD
ncbi:MAG: cell division protein FtsZ [Wolinella sp.]